MTLLEIIWRPVAPPGMVLIAVLALVALTGIAHARARVTRKVAAALFVWRLLAISTLAIILMGPSRRQTASPTQRLPQLTILLDQSQSMRTDDVRGHSRIDDATKRWLSKTNLARAAERFDLRLLGFSNDLAPLSIDALETQTDRLAAGQTTNLVASLEALLHQRTAMPDGSIDDADAGVLILSDGHDTQGLPAAPVGELAQARQLPFHTITLGGPTLTPDIALTALPRPDYLLAGEPGEVLVDLYHVGLTGQVAQVHLRRDDSTVTREVELSSSDGDIDQATRITFPIEEAEPGLYRYVVEAQPQSGELELSNNKQTVYVHVTDRRLRVLLLDGEPFWDSKFLAQSLRRDDRVELVQITQVTQAKRERIVTRADDGRESEAMPVAVPDTLDQWSAYDVVILGRAVDRLLDGDDARRLSEYVVERGGHVIFARGRAFEPGAGEPQPVGRSLAVLEPVEWSDGSVRDRVLAPTAEGLDSPLFSFEFGAEGTSLESMLGNLPRLSADPAAARIKVGATALARLAPPNGSPGEEDPPALALMRYGRGDVALVAAEGLWQWRLLPPARQHERAVYDTLWSTLVRWLAMGGDFKPGEQASLRLSRSSVRLGDEIVANIAFKRAPPGGASTPLTVTDPGGNTVRLEPRAIESTGEASRFRANYHPTGVGEYTVELDLGGLDPQAAPLVDRFSVYDVNIERLHSAADPDLMRSLSASSGGIVLGDDDVDRWPQMIERVVRSRSAPGEPHYIWDRWWVLWAVLLWLGAEWIMRRRLGLL